MSEVVSFDDHYLARSARNARSGIPQPNVFFNRTELSQILQVYGRMVAKSEWRDYAIGETKTACIFAIFHRTADRPLFRIYKEPRLASKQGAYSVLSQNGRVLKRGQTLAQVLKVFDARRFKAIEDD
ncbi:DUF2794 domain-containing protein [Sneathiella chungangensis]|uniref:DUF2794 domain-containing protein n=1 Tax=Sneathiella chungangensis TaxID=1418234 RepID=A0A845MJ91_9PROT|nr:DUF2794 domain-containing protein [Sneathiella chungangensis]MZR23347.1 DUF2794 domain-containing protein [Sneathiella chungangensis]